MLPQPFDAEAEGVTIKILSALSRFENIDDLTEDSVASILVNKALRARMGEERDIERQTILVRDAIVEDAGKSRAELAQERLSRESAEKLLAGQQATSAGLRKDLSAEQDRILKLKQALSDEAFQRSRSEARTAELEALAAERVRSDREESDRRRAKHERFGFGVGMAIAVLIVLCGGLLGESRPTVVVGGLTMRWTRIATGVVLVLLLQLGHSVGGKRIAIREWAAFQLYEKGVKAASAVLIGGPVLEIIVRMLLPASSIE